MFYLAFLYISFPIKRTQNLFSQQKLHKTDNIFPFINKTSNTQQHTLYLPTFSPCSSISTLTNQLIYKSELQYQTHLLLQPISGPYDISCIRLLYCISINRIHPFIRKKIHNHTSNKSYW